MGHSEYDPTAKEWRPWNVGRKVGAKRALKPQQVGSGSTANAGYATARCLILPSIASCAGVTSSRSRLATWSVVSGSITRNRRPAEDRAARSI